jgi:hypothetical protein
LYISDLIRMMKKLYHDFHFQDLEREKAARAEVEKTSSHEAPKVPLPDQTSMFLNLVSINLFELHPTSHLSLSLYLSLLLIRSFSSKEMRLLESSLVLGAWTVWKKAISFKHQWIYQKILH